MKAGDPSPLADPQGLLAGVVGETDLGPAVRRGKVRDLYDLGDRIAIVATDRLSAFDRAITTIPLKGAILNRLSSWWFRETADIVPNHLLGVPHPNVSIVQKCTPLPVEFVVRGYLTGSTSTSVWTHYEKGAREFCGHRLPDGLRRNDPLPEPILTPTTKSADHDAPISAEEIVASGLVAEAVWREAAGFALCLFLHGRKVAASRGLILVDTKYEFGLDGEGRIRLIDEIHTPDSSRFWKAGSGELPPEPENFDKEFLRRWFRERCDPYADAPLPEAPDSLRLEMTRRYLEIYETLTGTAFDFEAARQPIQLP